jgi:hypothetical protein
MLCNNAVQQRGISVFCRQKEGVGMWDSLGQGAVRGVGNAGNVGSVGGVGNSGKSGHFGHREEPGAIDPATGQPKPGREAVGWDDSDAQADVRLQEAQAAGMRFPSSGQALPDDGDDDGLESDVLPPDDDPRAEEVWLRVRARKMIREFLRAVPRAETEATLAIIRPDGVTRIYTRAELSAAIDRLRPRQRQIIRLGVEERWSRAKVCAYLHDISLKTFERDQVEALDILATL